MQVLKLGTKNKVTCTNCGSELQFQPSDISLKRNSGSFGPHDFDIEPEDHYTGSVTCPVCKTGISVPTSRSQRRAVLDLENRRDHDL